MSVNIVPPISLKEVQYNFAKDLATDIGSMDRYVRDFDALQDAEEFGLLDYAGAAFGMQLEFMGRGANEPYWQRHGSIYELPLDESDRRADYAVDFNESTADFGMWNGKRSVIINQVQQPYHTTPGACGTNGWFYASEVGDDNKYEGNWTLATGPDTPKDCEIWGMLFGYRYGYLDGDRVNYSIQQVKNPQPNTEYVWNDIFTVDKNFRHCLFNFSLWMPGYGRRETMSGSIHSCTIKRKP